jgi:transposase-like protein
VEIKKAYSLGIPKKKLARGKSQTEEEHAYGEEYTICRSNGSFFGPDQLTEALRGRVREVILTLAEAELSEVLAVLPYERKGERRGYRNGKRERWVSTRLGATVIELPRARLGQGEQEKEWQSRFIERYQRRARSVDSALLGCYLSGANGRRIRGALFPLLRGAPLSKSAISRLVGRLQSLFSQWRKRSLKGSRWFFFIWMPSRCGCGSSTKWSRRRCWWQWE